MRGVGLLLVSALLLGAAEPAIAGDAPWRVAVLYWSDTIPGQVAMRAGLERAAAAINGSGSPRIDLLASVAGDGEAGIERQIGQMYEAVAQGVDAIIVQPTDNAALAGPLREANARRIPVIAYDQYISGGTLAAFVTSDNYQAGRLDGEYVASRFPDDHNIRVVMVDYPHVSSTVERVDGFIDALHASGQRFTVAATYQAVEPVAGQAAGRDILRDFPLPGSLDVVFTVNDGGGLAVVEVLAAAGRSEILVATIDGDPASLQNIAQGRLTRIDAAQFCGPLGGAAMDIAYDILQHKPVAPMTLIPVFPITAETQALYPGWGGPIPGDFTKPWPSPQPIWSGKAHAGSSR